MTVRKLMSVRKNTTRVIIADDDPDISRILGYHLKTWRVDYDVALSKKKLIELFDSGEPDDLLLLDVRFGETDGLELIREIRQRDPNLHIVVITAFGSIDLAISAIKSGARDFLVKPIDANRLKALIHEAIEARDERAKQVPATRNAAPANLSLIHI